MKKSVSNDKSPTTTEPAQSASDLLQEFLTKNKIVLYRNPVKIKATEVLQIAKALVIPGVLDAEITLTPPEINARFEDGR